MNQVLDFSQGNQLINSLNRHILSFNSLRIALREACFPLRNCYAFEKKKFYGIVFLSPVSCKLVNRAERSLAEKDAVCDGEQLTAFPHIQTLRNFPKEKLFRKVVMVRFDTMILLQGMKEYRSSPENAFSTIKYLYEAGAKVILVGSWSENSSFRFSSEACPSTESVSDFLSSMLEVKIVPVKYGARYMHSDAEDSKKSGILLLENLFYLKGERANCSKFSKELASGVDIIVNDAFSESHKVLSSTVGVASFCYDYVAGFYFEEGLRKLKKIMETNKRPYLAIIGGGNLAYKAAALRFLASACDGLIFVGSMAFNIMHALGVPVSMKFVEHKALKEAVNIVKSAKSRNIPLVFPKDIWCSKDDTLKQMDIFSVYSIPEGWQPIDIGPRSLQEIIHLLSKCKKIMWIGPLRFISSKQDKRGTFKLAEALGTLSGCDITFVGNVEFEEALGKLKSFSSDNFVKSASVVWEVLKGGKLPGLMALDKAYPFQVDWSAAYEDPTRPLVVDVGSAAIKGSSDGAPQSNYTLNMETFRSICYSAGTLPLSNGLFLFGMASRTKDMNFLGLEINAKLVDRCLDDICRLAIHNVHFIATNATSTFRSIISNYPGQLVLVSIQCPNPDFNKPEYRWRMLQRSLVEAIADMLIFGGKVFLQSDIEAVTLRMKKEFIEYGKLVVLENSDDLATDKSGWLKKNPFGMPSDWEKHVLDRGDPMYRLLLSKVKS